LEYRSSDTDTGNSLKEVLPDLKKGKLFPCYLLYGEEEFLIKDALDKMIALILPERDKDLNLFLLDGEHVDIEGLCRSLLMPPLLAGKKVIVIRNTRIFLSAGISPELIRNIRDQMDSDLDRAAKDFMHFLRMMGWSLDDLKDGGWKKISDNEWQKAVAGDGGRDRETWLPGMIDICVNRGLKETPAAMAEAELLMDILKGGLPEGNHLILTANTVDRRKKIFKVISETGKVLHFPQIKVENRKRQILMDAVKDLLTEAGKTITPGAWAAIGKKTGFDVGNSMEAIEKLITYTGEKLTIEEDDVGEVIGKTKEDTIFDLTAALTEKNLHRALSSLKDLFDQGIHGQD